MPAKKSNRDTKKFGEMLPNSVVMGMALQLGFAVSTTAVLFVYGGHLLDEKFATAPIFFFAGIVLGLAASLGLVYKIVKASTKKDKE